MREFCMTMNFLFSGSKVKSRLWSHEFGVGFNLGLELHLLRLLLKTKKTMIWLLIYLIFIGNALK